jgi:nicotinamide-nucleotide amidase
MTSEVAQAASDISKRLKAAKLSLVTAESCTGGLIAAAITEIPGSSDVLERGYITYSNPAKESNLGVPDAVLKQYGAVSEETARAMAEGALAHSKAGVAISVTGVAGPDGGTPEKPVGLVHFAAAKRGGLTLHREMHFGVLGRGEVRRQSVLTAFALLHELLDRG